MQVQLLLHALAAFLVLLSHRKLHAGGLGVIGGVGYTPKMLQEMITELKV
jgi:hypothetical protein